MRLRNLDLKSLQLTNLSHFILWVFNWRIKMDLIGKKFGQLLVLSLDHKQPKYSKQGKNEGYRYFFLCKCDCGTERVLRYKSLAYKTSKSCGCYIREFNSRNRRKFPKDTVKSRIYTIWNGINAVAILNHQYLTNDMVKKE